MHRLLPPALALLLAACQLSLPGGSGGTAAAPANPITGAAIAVTSLDSAPPPAPEVTAPPAAEPVTPEPPAADAAPIVTRPPPQSPEQIACEKTGGSYARAGAGDARACIRPTRDGGKQCRKESDCEGTCLARSQTCAPITPMFGCNDILQDDGRRVTLCID
ncbi:MAG: hypothetical protein Q8Q26_10105 [Pseudorhodobacter sp.]|nr:hypothetical protein [Pseudorhodobacter sp.]